MLRFFKTKIGISLLVAFAIIALATGLKLKNSQHTSKLAPKVGLIASESVQNALKNGELESPAWEEVLKSIGGTSTLDASIARLGGESENPVLEEKPLTATDRFAQAFFARYIERKESGAPIDETTGISIVNDLLTQDFGGPSQESVFTENDLTILDSSSLSTLRSYGNSLGKALDVSTPANYENELSIVNNVYETEDSEGLKKLALNIDYYEKIRDNLLDVPAPAALKKTHLALVNSLSAIIDGVKGMLLIVTDPVGATRQVARYEDGLNGLELSTTQLTTYFKRQNVTFSPTEPGFIFIE